MLTQSVDNINKLVTEVEELKSRTAMLDGIIRPETL